jgi:hypothetical protein
VGFRDRRPEARKGDEPAVRSSVRKSNTSSDELINHTRQFWRSRLGHELSREDARQIAENTTGFFSVLCEWSRDYCLMPTNDSGPVHHPRTNCDNPRDSFTEAVNEVEPDAIPAAKLREPVRECVERHVDNAILRIAEQSERQILSRWAVPRRGSGVELAGNTEEASD